MRVFIAPQRLSLDSEEIARSGLAPALDQSH
jgi:hypothetical protein